MTDTMTPSPTGQPQPGLLSRLIGVLFSPRDTFAAVVARPKWFGAMAVAVLIISGAQFALLSTNVGMDLALEQNVSMMEAFGRTISDEDYAEMERGMENARYFGPTISLVSVPLFSAAIAGLLHVMFGLIGGGIGTYKQVYAINAHATIISAPEYVM